MPISGHIERSVRTVGRLEEFEDVVGRRGVDDGSGDDLVHCLVVAGLCGVVDETGAAAVNGAGEEGHAKGFLVGDALEGAD